MSNKIIDVSDFIHLQTLNNVDRVNNVHPDLTNGDTSGLLTRGAVGSVSSS
jgi:hypothetical protein